MCCVGLLFFRKFYRLPVNVLFLLCCCSAARADLLLTAPPRESVADGQKQYGPLAEKLTQILGEKVTYQQPKGWLFYQRDMRADKFDIVFDGPHFISWRIKRFGHTPVAKLPGTLVFIVVTEKGAKGFNRRNINSDIEGSFARLTPVVRQALAEGMRVRAYLSTVVECPYEGKVEPRKVAELTARLLELGCYQVSLGETLGVAVPDEIAAVIEACLSLAAPEQLALHLHDTYGTALASAMVGLRMGITTFDTSAGGLGGCPFAPGAAGNLATEDLVYALSRMGYATGVDLAGLVEATRFIHQHLPHPPRSRAWQALQGKSCSGSPLNLP